ncbi:DNA replication/repair protein RecF [Candidatus Peregrinibacteria bacterium]|nr:DNA replication/repair protein RecF [Candidatus Peregrinibacteria bacterium]MBI3816241.1 DNA replication/repair protein RecF [Candidatus Peregrinibacteria bacterium]
MHLRSLSLTQFRSYDNLTIDLAGSAVHLFVGKNGSGKTNLLEAIGVLSLSKSFLNAEEEHLVRWGGEFFRIRGETEADGCEQGTLEVASQLQPRRAKACFRNDVRIAVTDLIGHLPTVTFLPQDLELFIGPPAERRRFLDQILCQVSGEYLEALMACQRILKQRNALLKSIAAGRASENDLSPWDAAFAEQGSLVTLKRLEIVETFGLTLGEELRALGEAWSQVRIAYERTGEGRTQEEISAELLHALAQSRERDILLQSTGAGPHREDWTIMIDERAFQTFASRGQQRIAVLALLFLEASYVELRRGERPLILLDDVFSELDHDHRERILASFADNQILLTAIEVPSGTECACVWRVRDGMVISFEREKVA